MAATSFLIPEREESAAADIVARLNRTIQADLDGRAGTRPVLDCLWRTDRDGRLSCHWDVNISQLQVPPD